MQKLNWYRAYMWVSGAWTCACAYVHTALLIQHATRMRHIVTSIVAPRSPPYFSTLSHKRYDFRKKLLNIKCVFWFSLQFFSKTFFILRTIQRDIVTNVKTSSWKLSVSLVEFKRNLNFLNRVYNNAKYKISSKPVKWERVAPCGLTDMKLTVAFRNFANAPKKCEVSKEFQILSPVCDGSTCDYYSMTRTLWPKISQTKKRHKKNSKHAHEDCFLLELCDIQGGSNMTGTICV